MARPSTLNGFTIVELLIVIVVIGILALIVGGTFSGAQERARVASLQNDLKGAAKQLEQINIEAGAYPATANGLTKSDGTSYEYSYVASGNSYCLTATLATTSYKITSGDKNPLAGSCPGHGNGGVAAITNLITNPSFENNTTGWGTANGSSNSRLAAAVVGFGSYGNRVTAGNNSLDSGPAATYSLTAGSAYTFSVTIRAITAGEYSLSAQGTAGSGGLRDNRVLTAGQTARFSLSWTPASSGSATLYILRRSGQAAASHQFDVDGIMLTASNSAYNYADGDSPNWTWNGTAGNSSSTGPGL